MQQEPIRLKKVRVHNLKAVDLELSPGQFVVFTGVSGSGKSSLAFDTIYVEGQRRYIESLSHQARRFLGELPKPDAESISGIAPTIAIEQKLSVKTPRSTVGTLTGIYDFLRVLYARLAIPHCPVSGEPTAALSREKIIAILQALPPETKMIFLAPYAKEKKGEFKEEFAELRRLGLLRLRVDGSWVDLTEEIALDGKSAHNIEIVVDRVVGEEKSRIAEATLNALEIGKGFFSLFLPDTEEERFFSEHAFSKASGLSYEALQPHDFSFNHPKGMCPHCQGLGVSQEFDLAKIIDPERSISEDCCSVASSYQTVRYGNIFDNLARLYHFSVKTPWKKLSEEAKNVFLYGTKERWTRMLFVHPTKKTRWHDYITWRGVLHEALMRLQAAKSEGYRKKMEEQMHTSICPVCKGARIKSYPAAARLSGKTIAEITAMTLLEAESFFDTLELTEVERQIGEELLKEIRERIHFLLEVGLSYLSLDRTAPTLSGGESQRIRLASQIGAGLVGAIYVLDEPSIGLHPTDHHRLIQTLFRLRDQGNSVLVVEHDAETILAADTVVDVGPGAGRHGGEILACGPPQELLHNPRSLTGAYLSGKKRIEVPKKRRRMKEAITIRKATHHNLQALTVSIPLGGLVCVTGVSGSGKSSLITDILYPALANALHHAHLPIGTHKKIDGIEKLDKVIAVDQSPIGRTPRSNAATYIKLFDEIRDLFAQLPEAKMRGLKEGHFSFNVKEGSCLYCHGLGQVKIDMDFMEDVWIECPQCKGERFDPEILAIRYKEKSICDILKTDVERALSLFESIPSIRRKLELLSRVGLDYLTLGQPSTTLSGGEAQRIKLARELVRPARGKTLYILDEPTTGLHMHDIQKLIAILQQLVEKGNTVLVIEHNLDLIRTADWILDLGPGPGAFGGKLVGEGAPEKIAKLDTPTGHALKGGGPVIAKTKTEISPLTSIDIVGAQQNNLKSLSLSIPRGKISLFTGPSGSGKSSLAFETLYAEGQRRYTETLSPYARSLVMPLAKPKVDKIDGLPPSIALEQKTGGLNPRSTVGTMAEVYDFLRILYAQKGTAFDPETGEEIRHISKESVVSKIMTLPLGEKIQLLAPLTFQRGESFEELLARLNKLGFLRIRLNGTIYEIDAEIPFERMRKNELLLVIDRLLVDPKNEKRLFEAIEKATQVSGSILFVATEAEDLYFNLAFANPRTGTSFPSLTPQTFSFNHNAGMCFECQGLGVTFDAHLSEKRELLRYSILDLADRLFKEKGSSGSYRQLESYFTACGIDCTKPLKNFSSGTLSLFLHGGPEKKMKKGLFLRWVGLNPLLANAARMGKSFMRESILALMYEEPCASCAGSRLNPLARNVRLAGVSLVELCRMPISQAHAFLRNLSLEKEPFLKEVHEKICSHLSLLDALGLSYLSLERSAPTLSGGELQRVRLARQLGGRLTSCLYVLDEPTIGLHPYNSDLLNRALVELSDLGNTLILVEHDPMTIRIADQLFDFGPKAGREGGRLTASGTLDEICQNPNSLTGAYLSGRKKIPLPEKRRPFSPDIRVENASLHNLKNISVAFPYGAISCLTGVSGSGKSTLVRYLLKSGAEKAVQLSKKPLCIEVYGAKIYGLSHFERVVTVDQSPIGQTARADVSTYSEIQPLLRAHFASLPLARAKGLQPRHFSPNHRRGMCRTCWGLGYKVVHLQFLPSVRVPCESCRGYRLNPISLEVHYKGKHLGELLKMSIEEAIPHFCDIPRIVKRLNLLQQVGLSYLQLGQEVATLSGGEAQRLRLSRELAKRESGKTLYLIDEPTVGLHSEDIARLLPIFHRLADKKNTLILIEHNLDLIAHADHIVDLGPDAGENGGHLIATGTPEELAQHPTSRTAPYLREYLLGKR